MKQEPVRLRLIQCDCDRCCGVVRRPWAAAIGWTIAISLPVYGLLWAAWTILPR